MSGRKKKVLNGRLEICSNDSVVNIGIKHIYS